METSQRKQRSKYTNPEGSNITVSDLWFTVGGKIWKIEPTNTEDSPHRRRSPVTLFLLHLIWFKKVASKQCKFFLFCRLYHIHLFKKFIRKQGFLLNLHPDRRNLSIYEPTSLYFFLFRKSFNAHARCTRRCFCTKKNDFWFTDWFLTKAIVVCRELRSCTCSWGRDVFFF